MRYELLITKGSTPAKYQEMLIVALVKHGFEVYEDYDQTGLVIHVDDDMLEQIKK
jgi:hypothetical protein